MQSNQAMKEFVPSRWLRNPHAMTSAAAFWRRKYPRLLASTSRLFDVERGTQIRGECHMHENPRDRATIVVLHGRIATRNQEACAIGSGPVSE
jgi:predicted alpha/beta-fold hydrolase